HDDYATSDDQQFLLPCHDVEFILLMSRRRATTVLIYALVIATLVVLLFPFYWMFITAIRPGNQLLSYPPRFFPDDGTFAAFARVLREGDIFVWFKNSAIVTVLTILVAVPVSSLAGYAMSRFSFRGVRETG